MHCRTTSTGRRANEATAKCKWQKSGSFLRSRQQITSAASAATGLDPTSRDCGTRCDKAVTFCGALTVSLSIGSRIEPLGARPTFQRSTEQRLLSALRSLSREETYESAAGRGCASRSSALPQMRSKLIHRSSPARSDRQIGFMGESNAGPLRRAHQDWGGLHPVDASDSSAWTEKGKISCAPHARESERGAFAAEEINLDARALNFNKQSSERGARLSMRGLSNIPISHERDHRAIGKSPCARGLGRNPLCQPGVFGISLVVSGGALQVRNRIMSRVALAD